MGTIDILKKLTQLFINCFHQLKNNHRYKVLLLALVAIKIHSILQAKPSQIIKTIPFSDFFNALNLSAVKEVIIHKNSIISIDMFNNIQKVSISYLNKSFLLNKLHSYRNIIINMEQKIAGNSKLTEFVLYFLVPFITTFVFFWFMRGGSLEDLYKSKKSKQSKRSADVKFSDIIGLEQCKLALKENVDYFFNEEKYKNLGARMRRGVLLYGPPGTGKTTLAKACSHQANVSFFSCNAAEFCEIYVGMGPKKVRDLFEKAKKEAPSIIYIDELDAFGSRANGMSAYESANSEKNSTINQILSEMDGFDSSQQVLVIGSTNRLEMVDPSLTRAGRFDAKIYTPLPNEKERVQLCEHYLKNKYHELSPQFIQEAMKRKQKWSGAQIETLINQSVYQSLRNRHQNIQQQDFKAVMNRMERNYR